MQLPNFDIASDVLLVNNAATIGSILPLDKKEITDIINEYHLFCPCDSIALAIFANSCSRFYYGFMGNNETI